MAIPKQSEQRNNPRLTMSESAYVRYHLVELDGKEKMHASPVRDWSVQGVKVECHEPVPIGQVLKMDLHLDDIHQEFHLIGQIRWCLEVDQTPTYFAGICFIEDGSKDYKCWQKQFL